MTESMADTKAGLAGSLGVWQPAHRLGENPERTHSGERPCSLGQFSEFCVSGTTSTQPSGIMFRPSFSWIIISPSSPHWWLEAQF